MSSIGRAACLCLILSGCLLAQTMRGAPQREYPYPLAAVKAALTNLGAYQGARLPTMEGFVDTDKIPLDQLKRPYNEYKIDLQNPAPDRTVVRVKANVTAWYTSPDQGSGYRALQSNGRLEADLLDRLSDYLKNKSSDPVVLKKRLAEVAADTTAARSRIADLQAQLAKAKNATAAPAAGEFASVHRGHVAILSAPSEHASVLLRPELDDEFAVLEHRGPWLHVQLDGGHSGWVLRSQVQSGSADSQSSSSSRARVESAFTVFRETSSEFSGDWPRLQGRQALYIWAQPGGPVTEEDRVSFAQSVFKKRYREAIHVSHNPVEGIVIIFMDARGAVAAAAMDDIRLWTEGALSDAAFLKKCSLDPRAAFEVPQAGKPAGRAQRRAPSHPPEAQSAAK
jgi:hypothetical protein